MVPYAFAGAIMGGLIGYAVDRSPLALKPVEDCVAPVPCVFTRHFYATVGTGAGFLAGTFVGYLIERR